MSEATGGLTESLEPQPELSRNRAFSSRQNRMTAIREKQRRSRDWISLNDIADWCARESGGIIPDEARRVHTFAELRNSIMLGDFEVSGRDRVLLLNPYILHARLTRGRLAEAEESFRPEDVRSEFIAMCLIPRDLCILWMETKRISLPAWLRLVSSGQSGGAALSGGAKGASTQGLDLLPEQAANPGAKEAFAAMHRYAREQLAARGEPPKRDPTAQATNKMTGYPVRRARELYKFLPPNLRNPSRKAPK